MIYTPPARPAESDTPNRPALLQKKVMKTDERNMNTKRMKPEIEPALTIYKLFVISTL